MEKKKKKILWGISAFILLVGATCAGAIYYYLFAPQFYPPKTAYIYIDRDDTADSIYNKVQKQGYPKSFTGFLWMAQYKNILLIYIRAATPSAQKKTYITYSAACTEVTRNP